MTPASVVEAPGGSASWDPLIGVRRLRPKGFESVNNRYYLYRPIKDIKYWHKTNLERKSATYFWVHHPNHCEFREGVLLTFLQHLLEEYNPGHCKNYS